MHRLENDLDVNMIAHFVDRVASADGEHSVP